MLKKTITSGPDVVAQVEQRVSQAAELAAIEGQHRLTDPRTNPAVRRHADELLDEQHRRYLDDGHRRALRRIRVQDQRAASAERALLVIQQAREATGPAQSVLALHIGRQRAMAAALAASVALMAGAATGVAALAESWDIHGGAGWVAEAGMTGLSTAAILVRSHLARHGHRVSGWQSRALWALAIVPMLASIVANATAAGPIGIACSIGAAAFATLAHLIAVTYGDAIQAQADRVTAADEAGLRAVALGEEPVPAPIESSEGAPETPSAPAAESASESAQAEAESAEEAPARTATDRDRERDSKAPRKKRPNKGVPVPALAGPAPELPPRALSDEALVERFHELRASGELPADASARQVQRALKVGWKRAQRVAELAATSGQLRAVTDDQEQDEDGGVAA